MKCFLRIKKAFFGGENSLLRPPKMNPIFGGFQKTTCYWKMPAKPKKMHVKCQKTQNPLYFSGKINENQWKSKCQYPRHEINFSSKKCFLTLINNVLRKQKNTPHPLKTDYLKWWHALIRTVRIHICIKYVRHRLG